MLGNYFNDDELRQFLDDIYNARITTKNLSQAYQEKVLNVLKLGVQNFTEMTPAVEDNLALFAGAKQHKLVKEFTELSKVAESSTEFQKAFLDTANNVNNNWLYTEQNTAGKIANSGDEWQRIQDNKALFPLLRYSAILDDRTREDHEALNGMVRPADDPIWNEFFPPNGYNCRCLVEQLPEGSEPITKTIPQVSEEEVPQAFRNNFGKSKKIFTTKHPYFDGTTAAQRRDNFGLGLPSEALGVAVKPPKVEKPKPKKQVIEAPEEVETITANSSVKKIKEYTKEIFDKESDFEITKITVSTSADRARLVKQVKKVEELLKDYKTPKYLSNEMGTKLRFASTKSTHGVVETASLGDKVWRWSINFGHTSDLESTYKVVGAFRRKSKVDLINTDLATTVHEFMHVLSTSDSSKNRSLWADISKIRNEYHSELNKLRLAKASDLEIDEIYLGRYANTNIDEFAAEAFKEYKLRNNPSKYAKKLGKLIDKNFKK